MKYLNKTKVDVLAKKKQYSEIDALYAIGIILVLIGHSHSSNPGAYEGTDLWWVVRFVYTFHMPLFFAISGFLFLNSGSYGEKGIAKWILDKAARLLIPYAVWSLIGLVPKYYAENGGFNGLNLPYVLGTIIVPRHSVWGHFWFLPVLFLTYLIFAIWRKWLTESNMLNMCLGVLAGSVGFYFLPITTGIIGLSDLRTSCFYFAVGMLAYVIINCDMLHIKSGGGYCKESITSGLLHNCNYSYCFMY